MSTTRAGAEPLTHLGTDRVADVAPRLQRALVARYGVDLGSEAAAEAVAWGLEHADRLAATANPAGYLYRVGQTAARRLRRANRGRVAFPQEQAFPEAPGLSGDVFAELARLRHEQRVAVLLVHGYRFTYREVAELLDITESAVTNHVHRGLAKLRRRLEESA